MDYDFIYIAALICHARGNQAPAFLADGISYIKHSTYHTARFHLVFFSLN